MPIRFKGSVRPRHIKSPDPMNMPLVRENIVPRISAEVAYYKANGELPRITTPFENESVLLTDTGTNAVGPNLNVGSYTIGNAGLGSSGQFIDPNSLLVVNQDDPNNGIRFYTRPDAQSPFTFRSTNGDNNFMAAAKFQTATNGDVWYHQGDPDNGSFNGRSISYPYLKGDISLFDGNVDIQNGFFQRGGTGGQFGGRRQGDNIEVWNDILFTSFHGFGSGTRTGGIRVYNVLNSVSGVTVVLNGTNLGNNHFFTVQGGGNSSLEGFGMCIDGNRLITSINTTGSIQTSTGVAANVYEIVNHDTGANTLDINLIGTIPHPTGLDERLDFRTGGFGKIAALYRGSGPNHAGRSSAVLVYQWNGSSYEIQEWVEAETQSGTPGFDIYPTCFLDADNLVVGKGDQNLYLRN